MPRTHTHRVVRRALTAAFAICATAAFGCSGEIEAGTGLSTPGVGADGDGRAGSGDPNAPSAPGGAGGADGPGSDTASAPDPAVDPGRVTLHRLNRVEYANTVRDLLGTTLRPADDFPADDRGYGYDNIADVLSLSPVQIEMYFNAAEALIDEAMNVVQVGARRYQAEAMDATTGAIDGTAFNLYSAGSLQQSVPIAASGEYRIAVRAWAQQGGPDPARMSIDVDGLPLQTFDVTAVASAPARYEVQATLEAGNAILGASFLQDFYDAETGEDLNLLVDFIEIEGPLGVDADNPLRARIMICDPDPAAPEPCLREIAQNFGRRAYRRPLTAQELDALVALPSAALAAGDDLERAMRLMLRTMLVSPHFIFRVETDPDPAAPVPHALSDHELASRLSYFLWSSMPDDALLELADAGMLQDDAVLRDQALRMLQDDRAKALLDNFAGQWLFIRALDDHEPDYATFPDFDAALRAAMRTETELYFREFLFGEQTMDQLLTADFSFVDDRLAAHYGLPDAAAIGAEFTRVSLEGSARRGLLTQAGLLTVTSYPTRTSPVKRGKWVLEQLLCAPPPPPPPGVEGLTTEEMPQGSLRERMEAHRTDPVCASCHTAMDPIGFGFENYDGIGKYRDTDQGFDIDPSGMLPDGTGFSGPIELAGLLAQDDRLPRCMAQQLFTYALGRGPERYDRDDLTAITQAFVSGGYHFRELAESIVLSDAFRMRRAESDQERATSTASEEAAP